MNIVTWVCASRVRAPWTARVPSGLPPIPTCSSPAVELSGPIELVPAPPTIPAWFRVIRLPLVEFRSPPPDMPMIPFVAGGAAGVPPPVGDGPPPLGACGPPPPAGLVLGPLGGGGAPPDGAAQPPPGHA